MGGAKSQEMVKVETEAVGVVERAAVADTLVLACQIGLTGVLAEDNQRKRAYALEGGVAVRGKNSVSGDAFVVDESISGFDLGAAAAGGGELEGRLAAEAVHQEFEAAFETFVVEISGTQFVFSPGLHGSSKMKKPAKG
jgi:hypothetical protein